MEDENEELDFLLQFAELEYDFEVEAEKVSIVQTTNQPRSFAKEILVVIACSIIVMLVFYTLFSILGFYQNSRTIIQAKAASQPFFTQMHRQLIEDNFDGTIRVAKYPVLSIQMFYSPFSITSKHFRGKYYRVARNLRNRHTTTTPYFGAVNCFDSGGKCRKKYRIDKYPILMASTPKQVTSVYNGPLDEVYVTRWLNRLQNVVLRISFSEQMSQLAKQFDLIVIIFAKFDLSTTNSPIFSNFTTSAFQYYDGDPNSESTIFCVVTDSVLAADLQLFNENDIVFVNSELKAIFTHNGDPWTVEELINGVRHFAGLERSKSVEMLSLGSRALVSTQFAEKINSSAVFVYMTKNISYGDKKFDLLKTIAREYHKCESIPLIEIQQNEAESDEFERNHTNYDEECTHNVVSYSCKRNSTLTFMAMDSEIETQLATKFGADKEDVVIAIDNQQEHTKFIRGKITQGLMHCLIRQHHEAAENKFVVESSKIVPNVKGRINYEKDADPIGKASELQRIVNISQLTGNEKSLVVLFSGGVWHSASASVFPVFHQAVDFFSKVRHLIDFVVVDVTLTNVPYNFDFERLPKVLVTSAKSMGTSWSYPEELPISFPNLLRFITTRPSFQLRALAILASCDVECRKRSEWSLRRERTRLKLAMNRHASINPRQRVRFGYINRVLKMLS